MAKTWRILLAALAVLGAVYTTGATGVDPGLTLERIRTATLPSGGARQVGSLELEFGPALFAVEEGVLIPAEPFGGRPMEFVFLGKARFVLYPPNEVEAGQLELFTGDAVIDRPVSKAVLVIGSPEGSNTLTRRPSLEPDPAVLRRARELYGDWLQRQERRTQGVEAALFRAAVGDRTYSKYAALWCRTDELGDFFYQIDPDELEQVSLGQFVPYPADESARRRITRHLRHEQRKGRLLGMRYEDVGTWDVWLSSSLLDDRGEVLLGDRGVEPTLYKIDVTLNPTLQEMGGTAEIEVAFERDGGRVLEMELHPDLQVSQVLDRAGNDLFHFTSGDRVYVLLHEPTRRGGEETLEITYSGRALRRKATRHYSPANTAHWYPHIGTLDRARYDVIYRWPKHLDLVGSGRRIDSGRRDGLKWERKILEYPSIAASFELGRFRVVREKIGSMDLIVSFSRPALDATTQRMRQDAVRTMRESLLFYQAVFGPLPILEFNVVTVPREFSQAFLGYATLAESSFRNDGPGDWKLRTQMRDQTIAHEIAHQWWGNVIGWMSYRDQWLSEAMADYAALLFLDYRGGSNSSYLAALSEGWRWSLGERTRDGRIIESVGPLVLGTRLNSSKAGDAYRAIVYRKGSVVLAMLARAFSEGRFLDMLNALARGARDQVLATDTFIRSIEHMSGTELDEFADRYIYGTGIPEVYYSYRFEQDESEGWIIEGEARQVALHRYLHRVVRTGGGWDVVREREPELDVSRSHLMVPIRVELDPVAIEKGSDKKKARKRRRRGAKQKIAWMSGMLPIDGAVESFRIPVAGKPLLLQFDPRGEVLALFYSERSSPKRVQHYRGLAMAAEGNHDEAERLYLAALAYGESGREERHRDLKIRLDLARLFLDTGRVEEAREQLRRIEEMGRGVDRFHHRLELVLLESRIEIRRGEYEDAFELLGRLRPLIQPRSSFESWDSYATYLQFHSRKSSISEALALYALAAKLTGREDEFEWAVARSADRGCDLSLLQRP